MTGYLEDFNMEEKLKQMNLSWDGETVKQAISAEDKKHTPKEMLQAIQSTREQLKQQEESKEKTLKQLEGIELNIKRINHAHNQLKVFEPKCRELQLEELKLFIEQGKNECRERASKESLEELKKDPNAMTEEQGMNLRYVKYQRALATLPKVADRIHRSIITEHLFEKPIFENPWQD